MDIHGIFYHTRYDKRNSPTCIAQCVGRYRTPMPRVSQDAPLYSFYIIPALFGLSLIAPELITITITDKWNESAIIMQILCIGSAFLPIQNLYSNLVISKENRISSCGIPFSWESYKLQLPCYATLMASNDDFCLYQHQYQLAVRVALLYMERDTPHFMGCTKRCRSFRNYCSKLHGCCLLSHPIYR